MILMLVDGDVSSLTKEALHALQVTDTGGALMVNITGKHPTEEYVGFDASKILTSM
jgi:hypothetical protein